MVLQIQQNSAKSAGEAAFLAIAQEPAAPFLQHAPVDAMQVTDSKDDTVAQKELTPAAAGVCSQSFFDKFKCFPSWCRVRDSSWVTAERLRAVREPHGERGCYLAVEATLINPLRAGEGQLQSAG